MEGGQIEVSYSENQKRQRLKETKKTQEEIEDNPNSRHGTGGVYNCMRKRKLAGIIMIDHSEVSGVITATCTRHARQITLSSYNCWL